MLAGQHREFRSFPGLDLALVYAQRKQVLRALGQVAHGCAFVGYLVGAALKSRHTQNFKHTHAHTSIQNARTHAWTRAQTRTHAHLETIQSHRFGEARAGRDRCRCRLMLAVKQWSVHVQSAASYSETRHIFSTHAHEGPFRRPFAWLPLKGPTCKHATCVDAHLPHVHTGI